MTADTTALILAAGLGKRMKSPLPKVLHSLEGKTLLAHVVDSARSAGAAEIVGVIGPEAEGRADLPKGVRYRVQRERLGTGDAVRVGLGDGLGILGEVVVLSGDVPGLRAETIRRLLSTLREKNASAVVLSFVPPSPRGYGRMIRGAGGLRIVEERDASEAERAVREVNSGIYAFRAEDLRYGLANLTRENAQGEYYLTDAIRALAGEGRRVETLLLEDPDEVHGINTPEDLAEVAGILARRTEGAA